jgi:two-component system response regulator HydG
MDRPVRAVSSEAAEKLLAYPWPGNVRELQNCIEHAVALASLDVIAAADLPERIRTYQSDRVVIDVDDPSAFMTLDEVDRHYVTRVLAAVGGHRGTAARTLGVDRKTLYRKLQRWGR